MLVVCLAIDATNTVRATTTCPAHATAQSVCVTLVTLDNDASTHATWAPLARIVWPIVRRVSTRTRPVISRLVHVSADLVLLVHFVARLVHPIDMATVVRKNASAVVWVENVITLMAVVCVSLARLETRVRKHVTQVFMGLAVVKSVNVLTVPHVVLMMECASACQATWARAALKLVSILFCSLLFC